MPTAGSFDGKIMKLFLYEIVSVVVQNRKIDITKPASGPEEIDF